MQIHHADSIVALIMSLFMMFCWLAFVGLFLLGVAATVFWIWMIVDCVKNEPSTGNDKIVWLLLLIFTHWLGALIYYFVRRPQRRKLLTQPPPVL